MLSASLQERKPYNVFVPGDKVRFIKNLFWTDGANKNIGRTGTIKDVSYQGILKTYHIAADEIKIDKYGYVDSSFLAHEGEIEFCTIDG